MLCYVVLYPVIFLMNNSCELYALFWDFQYSSLREQKKQKGWQKPLKININEKHCKFSIAKMSGSFIF